MLALVAAVLLAAEVGARALGLVDFPLYDADATIGYIPKANQHGSFMNRNDWQVNELHMANGPFVPSPKGNILLVGDSIVWGGNSYASHERLGPQLQALVPQAVWTIAAGSWALQNELTYLGKHPELALAMQYLVLVSNSGDFDQPTSWTCEITHPRHAPFSAVGYLFSKYILKTSCPTLPPDALTVQRQDPWAMLMRFATTHPKLPIYVVFYPNKAECEANDPDGKRAKFHQAQFANAGIKRFVALAERHGWSNCKQLYKDEIHPKPEAYKILAQAIKTMLEEK